MRIILSSNPYRDRGLRTALEADRILRKAGAETVLCLPFVPKKGERLELPRQAALHKLEEELPKADLLVCFGGDGTILHAARDATLHGVPILGVNMGSVGFMAELERTELSLLVPLAKGHFVTEERMMLDIRLFRGEKQLSQDLALNDVVFSKGSMARVAEVEVLADQVLVQRIMGMASLWPPPQGPPPTPCRRADPSWSPTPGASWSRRCAPTSSVPGPWYWTPDGGSPCRCPRGAGSTSTCRWTGARCSVSRPMSGWRSPSPSTARGWSSWRAAAFTRSSIRN